MVYAAGNGCAECVRVLLDAGEQVNARYANDVTALMWAAAYGKVDTVKLLLARGADPHLRDNRGVTALMFATREKQPLAEAALRAAGAVE
jgi:ankyrin repeat protein